MTERIYNGEEGLAVRNKLNEIIDRVNGLNNVEDHAGTIGNPHNTYASQVKQTNEPLGPNVQTALNDLDSRQKSLQGQWDSHNNAVNPDNLVAADIPQSNKMLGENVQYALNDLVSLVSDVQQLLDDKADLHYIDGNRTRIQLHRGTNVPGVNVPDSLMIAELWCHYTKGELWTKLTDGSIVMIGSKDMLADAPQDGKTYARKDGQWVEVSATIVGDVPPVDPIVGTLWYDTGTTAELYVWDGDNWISMTGAGGGGAEAADNVVLDDADPTMRNVALAREINNEGDGFWRQIYTSDLVTENNQPMFGGRADDGIRNQKDANWYLLDLIEALPDTTISGQAPSDPEEGDLWFDNTADTMQLFLWHEESGAWLPVAPPTTLEGRVAAGETTQAAIIAQIQESLEDQAGLADRIAAGEAEQSTLKNKVNALEGVIGEYSLVFTMDNSNPRAGEFNLKDGAMQVTNTLASADYITLSDTDRNGNAINLDRITEGDVLRFSSVDGQAAEIKITDGTNGFFAFTKVSGELDRLSDMPYQFILLSSFDPAGLATVDYVDAQDATKMSKSGEQMLTEGAWRIKQPKSGGGNSTFVNINDNEMHLYHVAYPESATHAANMQYVDDQVAAIPAPSASSPAPLLWKYNPNVMANELGNGEFNLSASPTHGGAGEWHIYFSNRDARGQMWFPSDGGRSYSHEVGDQMATIRDRDAICCHGKTQKWYFNEGTNNYVKLKLTYYRKQFAMSNGKWYLITVPGYMPFFPYSANAYSNGTHS